MENLLAAYRDPLFFQFPLATGLLSMGAFLLLAAPLTFLAYKDPAGLRKYRIQTRRVRWDRVLGPSVRYFLLNNAVMAGVLLATWPLFRHPTVHAGPLPRWYEVVWQIAFFVYLDDFLYYGLHRALHVGPIYRHVHAIHHRVVTPSACVGQYMHPIEFVASGTLMLAGPLLVGSHVVTVWIWAVLRQWEAVEGHSGYSFPWSPTRLFPGHGGNEFHDEHHAKLVGNYAGFLAYVDRLFGTFASSSRARGARAPSRPRAGTSTQA